MVGCDGGGESFDCGSGAGEDEDIGVVVEEGFERIDDRDVVHCGVGLAD